MDGETNQDGHEENRLMTLYMSQAHS